jgi:hypothetical protein
MKKPLVLAPMMDISNGLQEKFFDEPARLWIFLGVRYPYMFAGYA